MSKENCIRDEIDSINPSHFRDSDSDSSDEDSEFRDALDRQMRELEQETGHEPQFHPKFQTLEEAKQEIERAGEEYRLKEEKEKQEKDEFEEFQDAVNKEESGVTSDIDESEARQEAEENRRLEREEEKELKVEERKRREEKMSPEEWENLKLQAQNLKKEGNSFYLNKENDEAISRYSEALDICPMKFEEERSVFYANRAAARVAKGNDEEALEDCHEALELNPNYLKVFVRRGQLYEKMNKPHEAMKDFEAVVKLDPNHREARAAVMRLPAKIAQRDEEIKQEMFGNLRKLGDMVLNPFGLSCNNFQFQKDENTGSYSVNFKQNGS